MSEENMNNQPENNQEQQAAYTTNNVDNKPNKSSKKAIIIISTIITLIVIAVVVIFVVRSALTSEAALKLETFLNTKLSEIEKDMNGDDSMSYEPFKCTGSSVIKCKSSSINIKDSDLELISKDIVFSVEPGIKNTNLTFSGDMQVSVFDYDKERKGPVDINIDCTNNAEIDGEKKYIINKVACTNKVNDITDKQTSTIYLENNKFEVGNFILLLKDMEETQESFSNIFFETGYAITQSTNSISSADLTQSIVHLVNTFEKNEEFTKESLVSQFEEAKAEIDSMISILGSSEDAPEVKILKDLFVTAENVLTKGHNTVDINVKLKDGKDVSDVLFLGFEPRLYDVSFSSK